MRDPYKSPLTGLILTMTEYHFREVGDSIQSQMMSSSNPSPKSYQNAPEGTSGLTTNIRRGVSKIATTFIYVVNSIILQQEYNDV